MRKVYRKRGHSKKVVETIMASWRPSTLVSYSTYIELWVTFNDNELNLDPSVDEITDFLQCLHESGIGYSGINTARSALSSFLVHNNEPIGKHPDVVRFMKGILNKDPPLPRYTKTWDLNLVLNHLEKEWFPLSKCDLYTLSQRLAILLSLTTGKRGQNLHLMDLKFLVKQADLRRFDIRVPVKNYSKQSDVSLQKIDIIAYPQNRALCPVYCLDEYIRRTKHIRCSTNLFVTSKKPYNRASRATISRWTKLAMQASGVNTDEYKPHSTRSASVSKAKAMGIPTEVILSRAGWKGDNCFAKYYLKPIEHENSVYQNAILAKN